MDRYGRTMAFVPVGDTLVNEELIRQGLAWVFTRYCDRPICQEWKKLEAEAREKKWGSGRYQSRYRRGSSGGSRSE